MALDTVEYIDNQTVLNTSLFTFLSSGLKDVIMDKIDEKQAMKDGQAVIFEEHINTEKQEKIPINDRYTIFLNQLFTNYFLCDLDYLGIGNTLYVNFKTTKDYSFSLQPHGNRNPLRRGKTPANRMNYRLSQRAENWGIGTVRNLEKYFEGYPDDQVLEFNFIIHKPESYLYEIDIDVIDPEANTIIFEGVFGEELDEQYKEFYLISHSSGTLQFGANRPNWYWRYREGELLIGDPIEAFSLSTNMITNRYNKIDMTNIDSTIVLYRILNIDNVNYQIIYRPE